MQPLLIPGWHSTAGHRQAGSWWLEAPAVSFGWADRGRGCPWPLPLPGAGLGACPADPFHVLGATAPRAPAVADRCAQPHPRQQHLLPALFHVTTDVQLQELSDGNKKLVLSREICTLLTSLQNRNPQIPANPLAPQISLFSSGMKAAKWKETARKICL